MNNLKSILAYKTKDKLFFYSNKISNYTSRNQSSIKYNNKTNNNNIHYKKNKNEKNIKNMMKSNIYIKYKNLIIKNLKKYNVNRTFYNIKIINDIIYDEKKHIVSVFKNYLLWDETSDFLKRFYYKSESIKRLPKISHYYEKYTLFPPVYFNLEEVIRIMLKNIRKKKKYLEMIEENEDNEFNINNSEIYYNKIINSSDIDETLSLNSNINNINNKENNTLNLDINSFINDNDINNKICCGIKNNAINYNNKDLGQIISSFINNSISSINTNKNFSFDFLNNELENSKSFLLNCREKNKNNNIKLIKKNINNNIKQKLTKNGKTLEIRKNALNNIKNKNLTPLNFPNKIKTKDNNNININKINFTESSKNHNYVISSEKKTLTKKKISFDKENKKLINLYNRILIPKKNLNKPKLNKSKKQIIYYNKNKNKILENIIKLIYNNKSKSHSNKKNIKMKISKKRKMNLVIQTQPSNTISSYGTVLNTLINNVYYYINDNLFYYHNKKTNHSNNNRKGYYNNVGHINKKNFFVNKLLLISPNTTSISNIQNFNHNITVNNSNLSNNNIISSSIYNINLNLNLGHTSNNLSNNNNFSKSINRKKKLNNNQNKILFQNINKTTYNGIKYYKNKNYSNIYNIINNNKYNNLYNYNNHIYNKNSRNKKHVITFKKNNKKKENLKILYDFNANFNISIHKSNHSRNINNTNNNNLNSNYINNISYNNNIENDKINIKINCNNDFKKLNVNKKLNKNLVLPSTFDKYYKLQLKKLKTMIGFKIKECNKNKRVYHDNSLSLDKLKKKIEVEIEKKKYPLTSRNEKEDIEGEIIKKILRIKK